MRINPITFISNMFSKSHLHTLLAIFIMAILLTACAGTATQAVPTAQPIPTTAAPGGGMDTLPVSRAKSFLADKLGISAETIQLVDAQAVEWPDSCLGVQTPGIMCAMHVVSGLKFTLSANGQTYELHTNLDGSQIVIAPNPVSTPVG